MFLRNDHGFETGGGSATLSYPLALPPQTAIERLRDRLDGFDWAPDLGARIGSGEWWRGAASCLALCAAAVLLAPAIDRPLLGLAPHPTVGAEYDETRAQSIAPLAWGGATGRRMAATDLVRPLAETPERPIVELTTTLGQGDSFARALNRAGVSQAEAGRIAGLVSGAVPLGDLRPGTIVDLTLGRRPAPHAARPVEKLAFRARFDLNLAVARQGDGLVLQRLPIAIDHSPLRIRGLVGASLYRSARAAGAPAKAVEAYLKTLSTRMAVGSIGASATFDIIVEQARAATGEVQLGQLLFAGLDRGGSRIQLLRWDDDGKSQFFEASGVGETRGLMQMPVLGRIASTFGFRFHPLLHIRRMHEGMDIAAPYGTPIKAAIDGVVSFAGRKGGYGNFMQLSHAGGLSTGYGHMSRFAVRPGTHVSRGDVIGYIGSTGLSTGPHVHWEVRRGGVPINPQKLSFSTTAQLTGNALRAFRAKLGSLLAIGTR